MDVVTLQAAKAAAKLDAAKRYPAPPDVQVFNVAGTWQKPAGAKLVEVLVIDAGGGGGSGRRGAAGTVRCGGGGGAGGGSTLARFRAADLTDTVAVTVGAGGNGGAAQTVDSTDGVAGSTGGRSLFGSYVRTAVAASGGGPGTATSGVTSGSSANAGGAGPSLGGGAASTTGGVGGNGTGQGGATSGFAYSGCGAGGGITSADVASNGGVGGGAAYLLNTGGPAGVVDTTSPGTIDATSPGPGAGGGGGGAASKTQVAQTGAAGGKYGAGGGGGGASLNGFASGAGGKGGSGVVIVTTHFDVLTDSQQWVAWGDSLTAGTGGGGTTYPGALAGLLGKTVANMGVGGETSAQIAARAAGVSTTITAATIAATGNTTVVPTPSIPSVNGTALTGILGGVRGTLTYSAGSVVFARSETTAASTALSAGSAFLTDAGLARRVDRQVIWVGRNDYTDPATVVNNAAAVAAQCVSGKYIVLSVLNGDYTGVEYAGQSGYVQIAAVNAALAAAFGSRYLDVRSYLIQSGLAAASITPSAQDLIDIGHDVPPSSLRSDQIHLTATGYTLVAQQVQAKIAALGY